MKLKKLILCYITGILLSITYVFIVLKYQDYLVASSISFVLINGAIMAFLVYHRKLITVTIGLPKSMEVKDE